MEQSGPLASDAAQPGDHSKPSDQPFLICGHINILCIGAFFVHALFECAFFISAIIFSKSDGTNMNYNSPVPYMCKWIMLFIRSITLFSLSSHPIPILNALLISCSSLLFISLFCSLSLFPHFRYTLFLFPFPLNSSFFSSTLFRLDPHNHIRGRP